MFTAIALVLVAVGSVAFHFLSPWWWTEIASNWGYIDDTIIITFWVTGVVFVGVVLFMAYCVYRYRYQKGRRAEYQPENSQFPPHRRRWARDHDGEIVTGAPNVI